MAQLRFGSPKYTPFSQVVRHKPDEDINKALDTLQSNKDRWVGVQLSDRISVLDEAKRRMQKDADRWISANIQAKGVSIGSLGEGEEWLGLATVFREIRLLRKSLTDIQKFGRPRIPGPMTIRRNGQAVVRVFPQNWLDRLLLRNITGEIWMQPGITAVLGIY
ncbi:MAG: hypothetical protein PVF56_25690 [Desulfobacterales bacterium]|jgi:hypothetical protein